MEYLVRGTVQAMVITSWVTSTDPRIYLFVLAIQICALQKIWAKLGDTRETLGVIKRPICDLLMVCTESVLLIACKLF